MVYGSHPVSKRSWTLAQEFLRNNIEVPIWHLYIAEAKQKLNLGDTRGFLIDLAIAVETLIRRSVRQLIVDPSTPAFEKMVGQMPVGRIIDDWFRIGFGSSSWRRLADEKELVKQVTVYRNGIMHRGENPDMDRIYANQLADAVIAFVNQGERELKLSG